jgi:hypothetical protein
MAGIKEPICLLVAIDQLVHISVQRNATQRNATQPYRVISKLLLLIYIGGPGIPKENVKGHKGRIDSDT